MELQPNKAPPPGSGATNVSVASELLVLSRRIDRIEPHSLHTTATRGVLSVGSEMSLVGRDAELRRLVRLLTDTWLGLPRAAVVLGEPGIGKSRLIDQFCTVARRRGFEVLVARAQPGTSDVPAGTLLPVLPTAPPTGDKASVLWWLRNTLMGLSTRLVIVIDDAHLADDMTAAVCASLAESGRFPIVFAARSTEPAPEGLAHVGELDGVDRLHLRALDIDDTGRLIEQIEGDTVDRGSVEEVFRLTGGVPLMVLELVRVAADTGTSLSSRSWRWNPTIASEPRLRSLFTSRLRHTSENARRVLWMIVAAQGAVPEWAAIAGVSQQAADETVERGLLTARDGWLEWSHALLGELAIESLSDANVATARQSLSSGLTGSSLADPDVLRLAAMLDAEAEQPDYDLQLAAARSALSLGRHTESLTHAGIAATHRADSCDAWLAAALAAISVDHPDAQLYIQRTLDTAQTDAQLLDATAACVTRMFSTRGDAAAANTIVSEAQHRTDDAQLRSRFEYVRLVVGIVALTPEEFLVAATDYLASDDLQPGDATGVQGNLSIMLATLGEVDEACTFAASARECVDSLLTSYDRQAGFFGGGLAALFAGDAIRATELVLEGSAVTAGAPESDSYVGSRSMGLTLAAPRGHCNTAMPTLVREADNVGSLRYGVMTRIYSVWELALRRDAEADVLWEQLQSAPAHLRAGPGFLEAFAGVALLASHENTDQAAEVALGVAEMMAPARSAARVAAARRRPPRSRRPGSRQIGRYRRHPTQAISPGGVRRLGSRHRRRQPRPALDHRCGVPSRWVRPLRSRARHTRRTPTPDRWRGERSR